MDVDRAFITRLAYGLPREPFAAPGEPITGDRLAELRELLITSKGESVPVKLCTNEASARVIASRLRESLGADFVVTVDEHGILSARARAAGEPARRKKALRFDGTRWMTTEQAREALGYSELWLRTLAERGVITRHHFGRRVLYRRTDIEKLRARRATEKQSTR